MPLCILSIYVPYMYPPCIVFPPGITFSDARQSHARRFSYFGLTKIWRLAFEWFPIFPPTSSQSYVQVARTVQQRTSSSIWLFKLVAIIIIAVDDQNRVPQMEIDVYSATYLCVGPLGRSFRLPPSTFPSPILMKCSDPQAVGVYHVSCLH